MHFHLDPHMVRGDLFTIREHGGGKWKYTVQIDMRGYYDHPDLHEAVLEAYKKTPSSVRGVVDGCTGFTLVVLEPYHKNGYPVALVT